MKPAGDTRTRVVFAYREVPDLTHGQKTIDLKCFEVRGGGMQAYDGAQELMTTAEAQGLTSTTRLCRSTPEAVKAAIDSFREGIEHYWRDLDGTRAVVKVFHAVIVDRHREPPAPNPEP